MKPSGYVAQEVGAVLAAGPSGWTVAIDDGECIAARALSCLVEPEPEDQVLLATAEDGRAWILAVLERPTGDAIQLGAAGDVTWKLPRGRFEVAAGEGIHLTTCKEAAIVAGKLTVTSAEATVHLDRLAYLGRLIDGQVGRLKIFADSIDSVADRVWQRVKQSFRFVEELDNVQANEIQYRATNNAHIQGRNALITAEQLVKVDADQIHLG
jgi:hypothetical protein